MATLLDQLATLLDQLGLSEPVSDHHRMVWNNQSYNLEGLMLFLRNNGEIQSTRFVTHSLNMSCGSQIITEHVCSNHDHDFRKSRKTSVPNPSPHTNTHHSTQIMIIYPPKSEHFSPKIDLHQQFVSIYPKSNHSLPKMVIYALFTSQCRESHLRAFVVKSTRVPGLG